MIESLMQTTVHYESYYYRFIIFTYMYILHIDESNINELVYEAN